MLFQFQQENYCNHISCSNICMSPMQFCAVFPEQNQMDFMQTCLNLLFWNPVYVVIPKQNRGKKTRFPSQMASNVKPWCFFVVCLNKLLNKLSGCWCAVEMLYYSFDTTVIWNSHSFISILDMIFLANQWGFFTPFATHIYWVTYKNTHIYRNVL